MTGSRACAICFRAKEALKVPTCSNYLLVAAVALSGLSRITHNKFVRTYAGQGTVSMGKSSETGQSRTVRWRKVGPETRDSFFLVHKDDAFSEHNMKMKSFHIVHTLGLNVSDVGTCVSKTDTCL